MDGVEDRRSKDIVEFQKTRLLGPGLEETAEWQARIDRSCCRRARIKFYWQSLTVDVQVKREAGRPHHRTSEEAGAVSMLQARQAPHLRQQVRNTKYIYRADTAATVPGNSYVH